MSASKAKRTKYGKSVSHTKLAVVAQRGQLSQARRVCVSRRSQLTAALRQHARPIVIEDQELAGPFVRLLRARQLRLWGLASSWQIRCRAGSISPTELTQKQRELIDELCARFGYSEEEARERLRLAGG